ncbi:class I SAM-dependent methyltransferase [Aliikangiella sp. IMCC44359]|uniref:class I SAM-dependent methyltransferase n=1 Tax=Aliikangiella sp. IMCC44359 TaxID=3459125 RepID=UPI00403AD698
MTPLTQTDPKIIDWNNVDLPNAWPDKLQFKQLHDLKLFLRKVRGQQIEQVKLPPNLPLNVELPKYLLLEFHNMPNGNYSKRISRGYITGFDISMLGKMKGCRNRIADELKHCQSVLDIGCAGGHTAAIIQQNGCSDIWGLDPSPYLLQHAAKDYPNVNFVHGIAEKTGFSDERFEGISACFVFHEIPPKYSEHALKECHRILKPGGLLSIAEPAPDQLYQPYRKMLINHGLLGIYFRLIAQKLHEPFVDAWHQKNYRQWAEKHGFELLHDKTIMPVRHFLLRKK